MKDTTDTKDTRPLHIVVSEIKGIGRDYKSIETSAAIFNQEI
jgi:hypothetical protein